MAARGTAAPGSTVKRGHLLEPGLLGALVLAALIQGFSLWSLAATTLALATLAAVALLDTRARGGTLQRSAIACVLLALGLWLVLAAALGIAPADASLALFQQLVLMLAFAAAVSVVHDPRAWTRLAHGIVLLGAVLALAALAEVLFVPRPTFSATFAQRNSLSGFLLLPVFTALPLAAAAWSAHDSRWRARLLTAGLFVMLYTIFYSTSRGALAALAVAFAGFYLSLPRSARGSCGKPALALVLWALLAADVALTGEAVDAVRSLRVVGDALVSEVDEGADAGSYGESDDDGTGVVLARKTEEKAASAMQRLMIWRGSARVLEATPWHGFGPGSFRFVYPQVAMPAERSDRLYAHCDPLQIAIELGVPGIALGVVLGAVLMRRYHHARRVAVADQPRALQLAACFWGIAAVTGHAMFSYNYYVPATLVVLGVVMARFDVISRAARTPHIDLRRRMGAWVTRLVAAALVLVPAAVLVPANLMALEQQRGVAALAAGRLEEAGRRLSRAARWYPNVQTAAARASLYLAGYDAAADPARRAALLAAADDAIEAARRANPFSPLVPYSRFLLDQRRLAADPNARLQALARHYNEALRLDPRYFPVRLEMARFLLDAGRPASARSVLEEGLAEVFPRHPQVIEYLGLLRDLRRQAHDEYGAAEADAAIARVRMIVSEGGQ